MHTTSKKYQAHILVTLLMLIAPLLSIAQIKEIGLPFIQNYSRDIYRAGTQNWAITQDPEGIIYFANNDGVLEFDGSDWELHPLPNGSRVLSVAHHQNNLYAGGFDEFGYFINDEKGQLRYVSLSDLLPEGERNIGEIWRIFSTRDGIVFQSFLKIIIFDGETLATLNPPSGFGFSYLVNNVLYVVDRETGLYFLRGKDLEMVHQDKNFYSQNEITFIIQNGNNSLLMGTTNNGIYKFDGDKLISWDNSVNKYLVEQQIYTGISLPGNQIAIGTIQNGLYVIDFEGNIVLHINRYKGLLNNTVLSLFFDRNNNLWLGLDNGIDALEISSPFSLINYSNNIETAYTSIVNKDILYIGTNQGLFAKNLPEINNQSLYDGEFELIEGTKGQVWSLEVINNELICGHNFGTFVIEAFQAKKISATEGGWDYIEVPWDKNKVVGGVFNGLVLYENSQLPNSGLKDMGLIKGFSESSRELYFDKDRNLWITHGYKGLYKLRLNEDLDSISYIELYNASNGLPEIPYSIAEINGKFNIVANNGVYTYDNNINYFSLNPDITSLFGEISDLSKVIEDYKGDIWYFGSNGINVLRLQEDGTYFKIEIPFSRLQNQLLASSFENIFVYDSRNVFIGSQLGMLHYDSERFTDYSLPYQTFIRNVSIKSRAKDSLLFHKVSYSIDTNEELSKLELAFRFNSIQFQFTTPYFVAPNQLSYSYRLKGFSDLWSPWNTHNIKEYTNLKEGEYTFEVRARNIYQQISTTASLDFYVKPPFYRTTLAYILYGLCLGIIIILNIIYFRKRIEKARYQEAQKQKEKFTVKEQQFLEEAKLSEEEIERLRNEKLLIEMQHKNFELANSTMHIIHKNKFLTKVKNDVQDLIGKLSTESNKYALRQIVKQIDKDIQNEKQWKLYNEYFDEVHQDFTKRLKEKHPELTPNDLRLCSYLRMNISTKEIAPLMNISIRGVEISRYRLRKKLDLDRELNLTEYILSI